MTQVDISVIKQFMQKDVSVFLSIAAAFVVSCHDRDAYNGK